MTIAIQIIVDALSVGSLYALTALGIGLIFGIMRLINFAHGEFVTIGAYMLMAIVAQYEPLAIIVSMVLVVVLALLSERIAFRPVRHASPTTMLVTSFAVSYFLQYLFVMIYGARPKGFEFLAGPRRALHHRHDPHPEAECRDRRCNDRAACGPRAVPHALALRRADARSRAQLPHGPPAGRPSRPGSSLSPSR